MRVEDDITGEVVLHPIDFFFFFFKKTKSYYIKTVYV